MAEKTLAKQIGARLRQARQNAGYKTILEFVNKHNFPKSTYNQYEIGDRALSIESVISFVRIFKTNLIWLITGEGSLNYSDDEIIHYIPEFLEEHEFLSIVKSKKKIPLTKREISSKKTISIQNTTLLADIFSKVLSCYQINPKDTDLTYISEISIGIYMDVLQNSTNFEELNNMIDATISTLSRTLSLKKNSS